MTRAYWHQDVAVKWLKMDHVDEDKQLETFKSEVSLIFLMALSVLSFFYLGVHFPQYPPRKSSLVSRLVHGTAKIGNRDELVSRTNVVHDVARTWRSTGHE